MPQLVKYSTPAEYLIAVSPPLIPDREWKSHLLIGLIMERTEPDPHDFYVATWVEEKLQMAVFSFHKLPINLTACQEAEDLKDVNAQIQLLTEFIAHQPQAVIDGYELVTGPSELAAKLALSLASALGREIELLATIRGSYIDKANFIPQCLSNDKHVVRLATVEDDIPAMARLVQTFQHNPPIFHQPLGLQELIDVLPRPIKRQSYYLYILPDGSIPALAMVRRSTPNGLGITMLVTGEEHRKQGYGTSLISEVIAHALRPTEQGGRGKHHVAIFWLEGGGAGRIYKKLGFDDGYIRTDWKFKPKD